MLRAIIIEDEEKARKNLLSMLNEYCSNVNVLSMEETVNKGIKAINKHNPDLIFLDVNMQGETGFDLLERIKNIDFEVVFTTAYDEYALKAFRFCALDYLLKPISIDELINAVERAMEKKTKQFNDNSLKHLMDNFKSPGDTFNKIALPTLDGLVFVKLEEIIRCESTDNYTLFFLGEKDRIMVSKTIKHFEELLSEHGFFRVHQSHLINLNHIKKYFKGEGGYVIMSDDSPVVISRRKKNAFLERLSK